MIQVNDVEAVLKEIRERVIAENGARARTALVETAAVEEHIDARVDQPSLDRLSAELAVTARAWDRLPPLISNRRGSLSRIEIWLKKNFKPLTRWFTWEQVNFNAAVHHALLETLAALRAQQEELAVLRRSLTDLSMLKAQIEAQAEAGERTEKEIRIQSARIDQLEIALKRHSEAMALLAEEMRKGHSDLTNELHDRFPELTSMMDAGLKKIGDEFDARLANISNDLREEQRVCFKQLSLETSEAAMLEDRGRRALEARLMKIEKANAAQD